MICPQIFVIEILGWPQVPESSLKIPAFSRPGKFSETKLGLESFGI